MSSGRGAAQAILGTALPEAPMNYCIPRWYAAYTSANREKRVSEQLTVRGVEHFLPLYESARRWKDRRVKLQLPLLPGYVFVRVALIDRMRVLEASGVARLVAFNGRPCAVPHEEVEAIRNCLGGGYNIEPHPYLQVGRRARVRSGPLQGMEGIILRRKSKRFVLSFELLMRSVAAEIDVKELEPVLIRAGRPD